MVTICVYEESVNRGITGSTIAIFLLSMFVPALQSNARAYLHLLSHPGRPHVNGIAISKALSLEWHPETWISLPTEYGVY